MKGYMITNIDGRVWYTVEKFRKVFFSNQNSVISNAHWLFLSNQIV
jgi:hypothetical protein